MPRRFRQDNILSQELLNKKENGSLDQHKQFLGAKKVKQISRSKGGGSQSYRDIVQQSFNFLDLNIEVQFIEEIKSTQKKSNHISHVNQIQTKRNRTDSNSLTPRRVRVNDFIINASAFLKEKQLENQLDKLSYQIILI
ncbi:unnamed protein product [Paramecium pentaurelia]|uniref:Uncharacterized protein n=1 Tax=Paramecium pentaurelia TaxID=43138 RepID=A0A8S1T154_9CILI|nr:unnamed protein product [Paramecium pentaurelia]